MELKSFISNALTQIAEGVYEAKYRVSDIVSIMPGTIDGERYEKETMIAFDMAVSVEENVEDHKGTEGGAEAGIRVLSIEARIKGGGSRSRKTRGRSDKVSRISFEIPMLLNKNHKNDPATKDEAEYFRNRRSTHP